jgi:hypothetical protein
MAILFIALAACGPGAASPARAPASAVPAAPSSAAGPTVTGAWAHPAAHGGISAAYFTLTNPTGSADALVSATSQVAGTTEIHQTTVDEAGVAAMKPVDRIELEPGDTVEFKPGGYHVMLIDLSADLTTGDTVELDLVFEHAGRVVVEAEVRQG